jgi:hypothetical protein
MYFFSFDSSLVIVYKSAVDVLLTHLALKRTDKKKHVLIHNNP